MTHLADKSTKLPYTKPTLIEYGSLAERTKVFGLINPDLSSPEAVAALVTSIASITL